MPRKLPTPCNHQGCPSLTIDRFCNDHKKHHQRQQDKRRGTAHQRGYDSRWQRYSRFFLKQPKNAFCKLQLTGCNNISQCVDHIDPPEGPNDKRFWDPDNHQAACIHCNSVKGHRSVVGEGKPFEAKSFQSY